MYIKDRGTESSNIWCAAKLLTDIQTMTQLVYLVASVMLAARATATGTPSVVQPAAGAHIQPGSNFDFQYNSLADYCASSYNLTVWLFTSKPTSSAPSRTWATGFYLGRFGVENYPGMGLNKPP